MFLSAFFRFWPLSALLMVVFPQTARNVRCSTNLRQNNCELFEESRKMNVQSKMKEQQIQFYRWILHYWLMLGWNFQWKCYKLSPRKLVCYYSKFSIVRRIRFIASVLLIFRKSITRNFKNAPRWQNFNFRKLISNAFRKNQNRSLTYHNH